MTAQPISGKWPRLFRAGFEWIDAASYWGNGKVYFFSGDLHIRDDMATSRAEPGYPQFIVGNY